MEIFLVRAISDATKLKYTEVVFVTCQFTALFFSFFFRRYLKPTNTSTTTRYTAQLLLGISMVLFSFGRGTIHFLIDSIVCYVMTLTLDPRYSQLFVTFFSVSYMSAIHLYFQFSNLGVNNLDYIGPLMILTEKLSSLAWSVHDGFARKEEDLNDLQQHMVVREYPSPLKFFSFIFCPQNLLVGPVTYYADYCAFIEGKPFMLKIKDEKGEEKLVYTEPSALYAITGKLFFTLLSSLCLLTLVPRFPIMGNVDDDFIQNYSFLFRLGWLIISIEVAKSKYFLAWVWADAINNAAGLGFNGYDDRGNPKWDGVTNVRIWEFQTATSLKVLIDNWNISGARWLRHVCFDRMPFQKKLTTFMLSSIWHGFYPGYFFTFGSASIMVAASQKVRVNLRHHFTSSSRLKAGYDVFTWACTHLCLAYFIAPFTFLKFDLCVKYFNSFYWFLHVLAFMAIIFLPGRKRSKTPAKTEMNGVYESNHNSTDGKVNNHTETKKEQ